MPHKRRRVSAATLHDLLAKELGKTTADLCSACGVPMPVFRESGAGPNWRLPALPECNALCHTILLDIAGKLAREYDLTPASRPSGRTPPRATGTRESRARPTRGNT